MADDFLGFGLDVNGDGKVDEIDEIITMEILDEDDEDEDF